jgi:hypothetical protein
MFLIRQKCGLKYNVNGEEPGKNRDGRIQAGVVKVVGLLGEKNMHDFRQRYRLS